MQCDSVRDLLEMYVLDQLDSPTQQQVESHLETCAECGAIVADYRKLMSHLPGALHAVAPRIPPAALKRTVMNAIGQRRVTNQPDSTREVRPTHRIWRTVAAGMAVLLIGALLWIIQLQTALAREQEFRQRLVHQTELIFEVVDSDRSSRAFMRPVEGANVPDVGWRPPYGKVFVRDDLPYIVAMGGRLPPPPSGQAYYLWLERGSDAQLIGEVTVDTQGFGALVYEADEEGPGYASAFITLQPTGETDAPANPVVGWREESS